MKKYEYDVAFSFASEDREYVEKVAVYLKDKKISVFYDNFEEDNLWGKNIINYLEDIYANKSKYCVIFISRFYIKKEWTYYESSVAISRMLSNIIKQTDYILPVKFDDTKIPGIIDTIGFINAKTKTPEQLGELIIKKICSKNDIQSFPMTIDEFKTAIITVLTTKFPDYWHIKYKNNNSKIQIMYSYMDYNYYLTFVFETDLTSISIIGEYTDFYFDSHIFMPSAKILMNIKEGKIFSTQVINIDFFDDIYMETLSPNELINNIKIQILKHGEK